jgi:hypothetical protein
VLDAIAAPLALVLQAARWLTEALAIGYAAALRGLYEELSADGGPVRLGDLWYLAQGPLFGAGDAAGARPVDAVARDFVDRWAGVFGVSSAGPDTRELSTLVFEECLRPDNVAFGPDLLAAVREPLELILESARWFTAAGAALFHRACRSIYRDRVRELGRPAVPFAEFWLEAIGLIFDAGHPRSVRLSSGTGRCAPSSAMSMASPCR